MSERWIEMADRPVPGLKANLREPHPWYEIRNAASDEAELLLFDEIGGWFGIYADEFVEQLNAITAPKLTVRLNSPGGSVFQGVAVANALRAHPAQVTVRVEGLAASIASVIALAGERLVMAPNSMFMIHDASGGCYGPASEMAKMAEVLDKISDNLADAYATKAGGTRAEWRERMLAETWYTADEAVEARLADELLVPPKPDPDDEPEPDDTTSRMAARWDLSVFRFAGRDQAPAPGTPSPPVAQIPRPPDADPVPEPVPAPQLAARQANEVPGWEGSVGPFPNQYCDPHVYARDVHSGAGNCVCGSTLVDPLHVQAAPGVPIPETRAPADVASPLDLGQSAPTQAAEPDEWTALAAPLITPPSAADEWETLREALL